MAVKHISKEQAVLNAQLWVPVRNWTLKRCAEEMGLKYTTLKTWLGDAGLRYEVRAAVLAPVDAPPTQDA